MNIIWKLLGIVLLVFAFYCMASLVWDDWQAQTPYYTAADAYCKAYAASKGVQFDYSNWYYDKEGGFFSKGNVVVICYWSEIVEQFDHGKSYQDDKIYFHMTKAELLEWQEFGGHE